MGSPSVGGMPATDGGASGAAKWCSSHCLARRPFESTWNISPSVGSWLLAPSPVLLQPTGTRHTAELTMGYLGDYGHLDIAVPDDDDDLL